jgi:peptidoglycan/xylan/chitin deacetylase (PgdA/CDA1 family)
MISGRAWAAALSAALVLPPAVAADSAAPACRGTVYLTLDTGNMDEAERIAGILRRQDVRATFFLANEKTRRGDYALDDSWAGYWRARAAEGHAFGSHTFDHVYFRGEAKGADGRLLALARPQFGRDAGRTLRWDAKAVCREIDRVGERFHQVTGGDLDPLWRAPGGRAPTSVIENARDCGYAHVYWADAGFLGDELPSDKYPNAKLLERALRDVRDGDILMAHLGIWSRKDPYAPTLEPLIAGLKARGLCFSTIREHPRYRGLARHRGASPAVALPGQTAAR